MKRTIYLISVVLFALVIIGGCSTNNNPERIDYDDPATGPDEKKEIVICQPANYGNGVYYFNCSRKTFVVSLSSFIEKQDSSIEVKSIVSDGGNLCRGYIVVLGKK